MPNDDWNGFDCLGCGRCEECKTAAAEEILESADCLEDALDALLELGGEG